MSIRDAGWKNGSTSFHRRTPRTPGVFFSARSELVEGPGTRGSKWLLGIMTLILTIALTATSGTANAAVLGQASQTGIFGEVTNITADHPRAVAGEVDITLATDKGPVELTANPGTVIRIPGLEQPSVEDIPMGSTVAILASDGQVASILVKSVRPVRTRHFTGIVTAVGADGIVDIQDAEGRTISALSTTDSSVLYAGDMVTAVLDQDLSAGSLLITGLDQALANLERIQAALERAENAQASGNLAALRQRLIENSDSHLTLAQDLLNKTDSSRQSQPEERLAEARNAYAKGMSRFGAGKPSATVSGIVTSIDLERKLLTVQPSSLPPVQMIVDAETAIKFQGKDIRFSQLDLANRVQARYGLESRIARRVSVSEGATLNQSAARALMAAKDPGEVTGSVIDIERFAGELPHITIRDEDSRDTVTLNMSPESIFLVNGAPSTVTNDILDTKVTAIFQPDSLELIELDSQAVEGDDLPIRGLIHRFVAKNLTGNLTVLTRDGSIRTFTRTSETVIRRNGRQVSINEVRVGDLVRANTRILQAGGASGGDSPVLEVLSLNSPPPVHLNGTVTGISSVDQGSKRVTITTNKLDTVSVLVDAETQVVQRGQAIGLDGLVQGLRIVNGTYSALTGKAARLNVQPPRSARISGEIILVEEYLSAITIQPRQGDPVILLFSKTSPPAITRQNERSLKLSDLQAGDRIRAAFYDPATNQVLRLVLAPISNLEY